MAALAREADDGKPAAAASRSPRSIRLRRRFILSLAGIVLAGSLALAGGFVWFATSVPADEIKLDRAADGIVVLTGGSSRIADAIGLLASGHGQRLLITGVHRSTRTGEISRLLPEHERFMRCCVDLVDLDYAAMNTLGNAVEARRWAMQRGFRSLIVVTSNYHMPRAMAELGHQLPQLILIPFPVVPEKVRGEPWWHAGRAKLLLSEYVKYIFAVARMRLDPDAVPESSRFSDLHSPLPRMSAHR